MNMQTSAMRREDVLRELNLHPLWQRRVPAAVQDIAQSSAEAVAEPASPVAQGPVVAPAAPDCGQLDWVELKKTVKECHACDLRAGCKQTVFGAGDARADWLFVGSWPTEDDENSGEAFSGAPGQLLDNMLAAIKLKRNSGVFLGNVVKCCGSIKRGPQAQQIAQCLPYLQRQIQLVKPKLIVVLGHAAATAMLGQDSEWESLLGKLHLYRMTDAQGVSSTLPLIVTHHPAALLLSPLNKAQAWKDLCFARDTMQQLKN